MLIAIIVIEAFDDWTQFNRGYTEAARSMQIIRLVCYDDRIEDLKEEWQTAGRIGQWAQIALQGIGRGESLGEKPEKDKQTVTKELKWDIEHQ